MEQFVGLGAHDVQLHVDLQSLARSVNVRKARFSMEAKGENATGNADGGLGSFQCGCISRAVLLEQLRRSGRGVKFVRIGLMPARLDLG